MFRFPSGLLNKLADEVVTVFKEKKGIYYSPSVSDGKNRVNSSGKFVQRINHMRRCYVESGLLVFPEKSTGVTSSDGKTSNMNKLIT